MTITAWVGTELAGMNGPGSPWGTAGELGQRLGKGGGISYEEGILVMGAWKEQLPLSCVQAEEGDPKLEPPNTLGAVPLQQQFLFSFSLPRPRAVFPRVLHAAGLTLGSKPSPGCSHLLARARPSLERALPAPAAAWDGSL